MRLLCLKKLCCVSSTFKGWSDSHRDAEIAWGTYCISCALKFLHDDCKLAHCNVNWDTIFVNKVGDWNLGGMDLLGPKESFSYILFSSGRLFIMSFFSILRMTDVCIF